MGIISNKGKQDLKPYRLNQYGKPIQLILRVDSCGIFIYNIHILLFSFGTFMRVRVYGCVNIYIYIYVCVCVCV